MRPIGKNGFEQTIKNKWVLIHAVEKTRLNQQGGKMLPLVIEAVPHQMRRGVE